VVASSVTVNPEVNEIVVFGRLTLIGSIIYQLVVH